jgi:hypothetical protein
MTISRKTRQKIAGLSVGKLARFKDSDGRRLHPKAIAQELARRIARAQKEHPAIVKHAAKRASRTLK